MRTNLFILTLALPLLASSFACGNRNVAQADPKRRVTNSESVSETAPLSSMIKLIADPGRYNGKRVQVIGFAHFEFEGNGIYLSKEDYQYALNVNGLWLSMTKSEIATFKEIGDSYVIVEGTFNADQRGHYNAFSGSIENITLIRRWAKDGAKPQTGEK